MRFNNMYIYNVINDLIAFNSFIPDYHFFICLFYIWTSINWKFIYKLFHA